MGKGMDGKSLFCQDQYDYLVRVMERWREPWENEEEKEIFVSNVMQQVKALRIQMILVLLHLLLLQTEGEERVLCGNQLASRVIELILPYALPPVTARYHIRSLLPPC